MLSDKSKLMAIIDRFEVGLINRDDIITIRGAIERLDEMDDLVEAVCSCRTQEIPIFRGESGMARRMIQHKWDDDAPGRP